MSFRTINKQNKYSFIEKGKLNLLSLEHFQIEKDSTASCNQDHISINYFSERDTKSLLNKNNLLCLDKSQLEL